MTKKAKPEEIYVIEMKYPEAQEGCPECANGWIAHLAPHKPYLCIMGFSPCPKCNADGHKPNPLVPL